MALKSEDIRHVLITSQNPDGKIIKVRAFLDTGCDGNLISQNAVQQFGLELTQGEEHSWVTGSGAKVSSCQEVVLPYVATHVKDKTIRVPFAVLDTLPDDVEDIILGNKFLLQAHYITFNPTLADIVDLNYSNKPSSPALMQMKGRPPVVAGLGQHSQARRSNGMLKLLSFSFPRPLVMIDSTRTKLSPCLERSSKHRPRPGS